MTLPTDPTPRQPALWSGRDEVVEDVAYAFVERMARMIGEPRLERSDKAASRVVSALADTFGVRLTGPSGLGALLRNALGYAPVPCADGCGCRWLMDADAHECGCGGPCSRWTDRPKEPTGEDEGPEAGHTFYLDVRSRGASRVGDGPATDDRWTGEPYRIAVRAHDQRTALRKAAALPLGEWTAPGDHPEDDGPSVATMDDGTILGRQTARALGIAGNGPPPRTTRYFLGVTDSGLKVSTAITGRWTGDPRPLPIAALREDMAAMTSGDVLDPLLVADESPQLWPVSREVYAAWNDLEPADLDYVDEDNEARDDEPVGPTITDPVTGEISEVGPEDVEEATDGR